MVRHVILWTLKAEMNEEEKQARREKIKAGLEGLAGKIPGMLSVRVETGHLPSSTADLMLDTLFADEAALLAYKNNPLHQAVANAEVRPYFQQRSCLDFEVKE